jgi:hypothetical protein
MAASCSSNPPRRTRTRSWKRCGNLIRQNRGISQTDLIQLNPIIRGWANYHRHIVAKDDVQESGMGLVAQPLALGQTQALRQTLPMVDPALLASIGRRTDSRPTPVSGRRRETALVEVGLVQRNQHPASRENPGRSESVRSALACLFGRPCVLQEVWHPSS